MKRYLILILELARKVEAYVLEIGLGHLQHIPAIGKEDIATFAVFGHILIFALLECLKFGGVVAFNPACLVETRRLPAT